MNIVVFLEGENKQYTLDEIGMIPDNKPAQEQGYHDNRMII